MPSLLHPSQELLHTTPLLVDCGGEIKVKEAKDILQTAQTGCIYCAILCVVLNQIHPGPWARLVEDFSARDITYASNQLPAIEAVMRRIASMTNWAPVYEMWKESLIKTLPWQPAQKRGKFAQAMPGDFAPTWSWTSIGGLISYQTVHAQKGAFYDAEPFVHHLKLLRADEKTGELMVEGKLVPAAARMR